MKDDKEYILSIDQGTTSSRAILFNRKAEVCSIAQIEFQQLFPSPLGRTRSYGNFRSQKEAIQTVLSEFDPNRVAAIGITNQRDTRSYGTWRQEYRYKMLSFGRTSGHQKFVMN